MEKAGRASVRGLVTLGVLGALSVGLLSAPVVAKKGGVTVNKLRRNVNIIHGSELGPGSVPDTSARIAQLDVPKGNYGVVAKVHLSTTSATGATVECVLANGTAILDHGAVQFSHEFQDVLTLNTALTLGGAGGTAEFRCSDGSATVTTTWQHVSISAFKLPKLTSIDLTP